MNKSSMRRMFYIFGAGKMGRDIANYLRYFNAHIIGYIDNNPDRYDVMIDGLSVCSLRSAELDGGKNIIISSQRYEAEILDQLINSGIDKKTILTHKEFEELIKGQSVSLISEHIFNNDSAVCNGPKILFDQQIFEKQQYGGILRTFYELISILLEDRCSIDFYEGINISSMPFRYDRFRRYCSFYEDRLNLYSRSIINRFGFEEFTRDQEYDIYHSTYYDDILECRCKKRVITIHDMIPEILWDKSRFTKLKKKNIDHADGIVVVSESTKKDLINLYSIDEDKIRVIYHGNSLRNVAFDPAPQFDFPYILYVGKREDYKNAKTLINAYSKSVYSKDMKIVFFGGGDFTNEELKTFENLGIEDCVVHAGGDDSKLANAYANAEVFVYPSKYEGFGIPLIEAMGCGCPVIASNISSIPEVGGEAVIYFDPESEENLAETLDKVLGDEAVRRQMIERGRKREGQFSWEKTARETLDFYNFLLRS